jgi:hypothetical protein
MIEPNPRSILENWNGQEDLKDCDFEEVIKGCYILAKEMIISQYDVDYIGTLTDSRMHELLGHILGNVSYYL